MDEVHRYLGPIYLGANLRLPGSEVSVEEASRMLNKKHEMAKKIFEQHLCAFYMAAWEAYQCPVSASHTKVDPSDDSEIHKLCVAISTEVKACVEEDCVSYLSRCTHLIQEYRLTDFEYDIRSLAVTLQNGVYDEGVVSGGPSPQAVE